MAIILLLLIVIAIIAFIFIFFGAIVTETGEATEEEAEAAVKCFTEQFKIDHTYGNETYIRNLGPRDVSGLTFYLDNVPTNVSANCTNGIIQPGETCKFTIPGLLIGIEYKVRIVSQCGNAVTVKLTIGIITTSTTTTSSTTTTIAAGSLACGDPLNSENTVYTLTQDVNSTGTCFTIGANNVTLSCDGYMINYSQSSVGYAINASFGYNYTTIRNCDIVQGSNQVNSYAIYLYNSNNDVIDDNTITTSGENASGILLNISSNSNILLNNTITTSGYGANGIYLYATMGSNQNRYNQIINNIIRTSASCTWNNPCAGITLLQASDNTASNNTINTTGNEAYGIYLGNGGSDNIVDFNNISTSGDNSHGLYIYINNNNNLSYNTISTSGSSSYGINFRKSLNNTIINNTISTTGSGNGIEFKEEVSHNNSIINSTINAASANDIYVDTGGNNTFINTVFDKSNVGFGAGVGSITVKWFLDVYVDNTTGSPISGADVTGWNVTGQQAFTDTTGPNGYISTQVLTEYWQSSTATIYQTNYTINATAPPDYLENTTQVNLTDSKAITITLTHV